MLSPTVIGLVLNYRDARRTIRCVQSLLDNDLAQVLIWDNSEDKGKSVTTIREAFTGDSRIWFEVSPRNMGFAAGVNKALTRCVEHSPNAWVLLINNDALLRPGAIPKLVFLLEENPNSLVAFSEIKHADRVTGVVYYHRLTGLFLTRPFLGSFPYVSGCCLLFAMDRMKPSVFDEDFFMYGEDVELGWRLHRKAASMVHVPEVLVDHEGSASSGLGTLFYESHMVAAHLILARKLSRDSGEAALLYTCRVPFLLARAMVRSIRFISIIPWQALWRGAQIARGTQNKRAC